MIDDLDDYMMKVQADLKHEFPGMEFILIAYDSSDISGFVSVWTTAHNTFRSVLRVMFARLERRLHYPPETLQ